MSKFLLTVLTSVSLISTATFAMTPEDQGQTGISVQQTKSQKEELPLTKDLHLCLREFLEASESWVMGKSNKRNHDLFWQHTSKMLVFKEEKIADLINSDFFWSNHQNLNNLRILDLHSRSITDDMLTVLPYLPQFVDLTLFRTSSTDEGLSQLTQLTKLYLNGNDNITGEGLLPLTKIDTLKISFQNLSSNSLRHLQNITDLYLFDNDIFPDESVSHLTKLRKLNISCSFKAKEHPYEKSITDKSLSRFTNLTDLNLQENPMVTDGSVKLLTNLTNLRLHSNDTITDESLQWLTNLRKLNLSYNNTVTDGSVKWLTNLTDLNLSKSKALTDESVKLLTNLTSLELSKYGTITNAALAPLTNLTYLGLNSNHTITDAGMKTLTNLTGLNLEDNDRITNAGLKPLTNLMQLNLSYNRSITEVPPGVTVYGR